MQPLNEAGYEAYRSNGLVASSTVAHWVYPSGRGPLRQKAFNWTRCTSEFLNRSVILSDNTRSQPVIFSF